MVYNKYKNRQYQVEECINFYLTHKLTQKECAKMFDLSYPIFIYYYPKYKEKFFNKVNINDEANKCKKYIENIEKDNKNNNENNNSNNNKGDDGENDVKIIFDV
jgi:hypothetical protein